MENGKIVISVDEVAKAAEKMQSELMRVKSAFCEAYALAENKLGGSGEELRRLRTDSETAGEICGEMERFIDMMKYVCGIYGDCAENIGNIIAEIKV